MRVAFSPNHPGDDSFLTPGELYITTTPSMPWLLQESKNSSVAPLLLRRAGDSLTSAYAYLNCRGKLEFQRFFLLFKPGDVIRLQVQLGLHLCGGWLHGRCGRLLKQGVSCHSHLKTGHDYCRLRQVADLA